MQILRKLLSNLGDVWNQLPKEVPFITVQKGTGTHTMVSVDEGMLHFHSAPFRSELPQKQSIVLKGMTSTELLGTIATMGYDASFTSEALSKGINENAPIILMEVSNVAMSATLSAFTSNLWRTMYPIYRVLRQAEFDTSQAMKQLQRPLADGDWLDFWASFFSISREPGESDNNFVRRFTMWLFNPKTNNIALKELLSYRLQDTAIDVHDKAPMEFELLVGTKYLADATALHKILREAKGAGIQYFLNYIAPTYSEDYRLWLSDQTGQPFENLDVLTNMPTKTLAETVPAPSEVRGLGSTQRSIAETVYYDTTANADFSGKTSGSTVVNPHTLKRTVTNSTATTLLSPAALTSEYSTSDYTNAATLNGVNVSSTTNINGAIPQHIATYDAIAIVERKYFITVPGANTAAKVAWVKANITRLTANWHGFGSYHAGNKASLVPYVVATGWSTSPTTHTNGVVTKLERIVTAISAVVDDNGFVHFGVYGEPSNGTVSSGIFTDTANLVVEVSPASLVGLAPLILESSTPQLMAALAEVYAAPSEAAVRTLSTLMSEVYAGVAEVPALTLAVLYADVYAIPQSSLATAFEIGYSELNDPVIGSGELFDHIAAQDIVTATLTVGGTVVQQIVI